MTVNIRPENVTRFHLDHESVQCEQPTGLLLDFLHQRGRFSVKSVCREGDCGACQVLVGRKDITGKVSYRTFNSCLLPLLDVDGCHVITTEGLNGELPTPVQQALLDAGAIQCGYCTPGFVVALTGWLLNESHPDMDNGLDWLSGNLCRCSGYMGMRRAIEILMNKFPASTENGSALNGSPLEHAAGWGIIPAHYIDIAEHLPITSPHSIATHTFATQSPHYGGGTDLAVEQAPLWHDAGRPPQHYPAPAGITQYDSRIVIGAATDIETLRQSPMLRARLPGFCEALTCFASRPVRHQATVGGNLAHASPAADLSVMLLALDAQQVLMDKQSTERVLPLTAFFTGYKQTALQADEWIHAVMIALPDNAAVQRLFHFEKISKRIHQDIASVNAALSLDMDGNIVTRAGVAAGGIGPVPMNFTTLAQRLIGQAFTLPLMTAVAMEAEGMIAPISDVRGSAAYKTVMTRRLLLACGEALLSRLSAGSA